MHIDKDFAFSLAAALYGIPREDIHGVSWDVNDEGSVVIHSVKLKGKIEWVSIDLSISDGK